jgi:hypothetical protein
MDSWGQRSEGLLGMNELDVWPGHPDLLGHRFKSS